MQGNAVPFDTIRHLCMQYLTYTCIHTCCMSTCLACLHVWLCFCFPIYVHVHDSFHLHCNLYSSPIFSYVCLLCHFDLFINWCICISMHLYFVVFMQSKLRMFVSTDIHILTCRNIYVCIHGPHMFTFKSM